MESNAHLYFFQIGFKIKYNSLKITSQLCKEELAKNFLLDLLQNLLLIQTQFLSITKYK